MLIIATLFVGAGSLAFAAECFASALALFGCAGFIISKLA